MIHTTNAYFNNYDLNALPGVEIVNYDVSELPSRVLTANKLARSNRSVLTSAEYETKDVRITGFVGGEDWPTVQENYDRMKGRVQDFEGLVRVGQGDTEVEYTGTLNGISKEYVGPNIKFTLTFKCSNPIGRDSVGRELFTPVVITTSTLTKSFEVEGSFIAQPRFTFVVGAVTGGSTNKSITLLNAATNKGIKITRNWTAGDILTLNSDTMEATVNGTLVDFAGQFPTFYPGTRSLQYIDDFTTRTVTLSSIYTRQYS